MAMQAWAREMARYNRWQNVTLYALTDQISDSERKRDRGMFFESIHHTLDHILMVDTRLAGMVETGSPAVEPFKPRKLVHAEYAALAAARRSMDEHLIDMADGHDDAWFEKSCEFASPLTGQPRQLPRHFYLVQLFNHATHHRSQVTAVLQTLGLDYGSTDLPMHPDTIYAT
jgi:uncharacterized damage-inducible protein DinB